MDLKGGMAMDAIQWKMDVFFGLVMIMVIVGWRRELRLAQQLRELKDLVKKKGW
jgi:hypothetical protein